MRSVHKLLIFAKMVEIFINMLAKLTRHKSLFITLLILRREIPDRPTDGISDRQNLFASAVFMNDMKQLANKFRVRKL